MLVKQAQELRVGDYLLIVPLGSFVLQARKVTAVEESTAIFVTVEHPGGERREYAIHFEALVPILGNTGGLTPWPA